MASMKKRARVVTPKECKEDTSTDGVMELSVTVAYLAADVKPEEIANLERLLLDHCDAGMVALEQGDLENHLHFQMVCRARVKSARAFGVIVRKYMNWYGKKGMFPAGKVMSKVLTNHMIHTWKGMIGYCLKDSGAAHFEVVMHNIFDEKVIVGKTLHSIYGKVDLKSKVCITNKNIGEHAYVWYKYKADRKFTSTMLSTLTDMINSAMFVPAATWTIPFSGQGMDNRRMNAYWKCMTDPLNVDRVDVADIFIRRREYVKGRYLDEDLNPVQKPNEEDEYMWEGSPLANNVDNGSPNAATKSSTRKIPRALNIAPLCMPGDTVWVKKEVVARNVIGTCTRKLFSETPYVDRPRKSVRFGEILDFIPLKDIALLPTNVFLPTVDALAGDSSQRELKTDAEFWESISNCGVGVSHAVGSKEVPMAGLCKGKEKADESGLCNKPTWIEENKNSIVVLSSDSKDDEDTACVQATVVFQDHSYSQNIPPIYGRAPDIVKLVIKTEPPCDPR